jgi:hypothetical protein
MSDENTTRTDSTTPLSPAGTGTTGESAPMTPASPVGSEGAPSSEPAAAPAGPGEDRNPGDREPVDSTGAPSGSPVGRVAEAAVDAARQAGAKLKEAAQDADLDELADQAKRVTSDWTERVKEEYRRRPGVVIGAAVGAVVLLAAITRGFGRRR